MKYKGGGEWKGYWSNGKQNGNGVWEKEDGSVQEGVWKEGVVDKIIREKKKGDDEKKEEEKK